MISESEWTLANKNSLKQYKAKPPWNPSEDDRQCAASYETF